MVSVEDMTNKEIGWKLRAARNRISETRETEFTQDEMGKRLGMTGRNIGKAERGELVFSRWNYETVERWAAAYEVDPLDICQQL